MEAYLDPAEIERLLTQAWEWLTIHALTWQTAAQAVIVLVAWLTARLTAPALKRAMKKRLGNPKIGRLLDPVIQTLLPLALPVIWLTVQWFSVFAAQQAQWPHHLVESVVSLLTAWVVIRLLSGGVRDPGWARTLAIVAWGIAALNLMGLLDPTMATLDSMALSFGAVRLSVLDVIPAGFVFAALHWLAGLTSQFAESRLAGASSLSPSARVLLGKTIRFLLISVALFAALSSIGIDLTALAVFSVAVGIGIGFGLQKVTSNLISGVILLMDKSVKPGDVIGIGNTFGWINSLNARYVSVITRDGTEHLIPNEELISQRVENWSHSDTLIRLPMPIGISYESDVELAMKLAVEATEAVDRVRKDPQPVCRLMAFGSDAVELELRVWIADPQAGVANVRSDVLLKVWQLYHEHGVVFPFAQRDLHIRSSEPVPVVVQSANPDRD